MGDLVRADGLTSQVDKAAVDVRYFFLPFCLFVFVF